jgi:hypothetical protein
VPRSEALGNAEAIAGAAERVELCMRIHGLAEAAAATTEAGIEPASDEGGTTFIFYTTLTMLFNVTYVN